MKSFLSIVFFIIIAHSNALFSQPSVARKWNEITLETIRGDFARPPVQARNLFHLAIAMYDAWAVYNTQATPYLLGKTINGVTYPFTSIPAVGIADTLASQEMAISYAAYRLLTHLYTSVPVPAPAVLKARFDSLMINLGYDTSYHNTNYSTGTPADLGNYIAQQIITMSYNDSAHQANNYTYYDYSPVNSPLPVTDTGNVTMNNVNRWQPLFILGALDQGGNPINPTQKCLQPEWGRVTPFAMNTASAIHYTRDGADYPVYHDPGMPPMLNLGDANDSASVLFKWGHTMVSIWSSHLDPNDTTLIDISPASHGNGNYYPTNFNDQQAYFYRYLDGGDTSTGYPVNPVTGLPYTPQLVKRGDYTRVVSQYWADGPRSETPPGHWYYLLNKVSDDPLFVKKYEGNGPVLSNLEWDIKSYFALGGAMHDAAIAAWSVKGWYDSPRPISALRIMAQLGQCTDSLLPHYHKGGLPLIPGYIELIQAGDSLAGLNNEHVHKIKLYTWKGFHGITNPNTDVAGAGWILGESWMPYQRKTFVTPPFPGYVSGHSTYSRAGAELLTLITGSPYFPGGLAETIIPANSGFLVIEQGPSTAIPLQWASYRDASDEASLSRIWGGIHPPFDDIKGRLIGEQIGISAHYLAKNYFSNAVLPAVLSYFHVSEKNCKSFIEWRSIAEKNTAFYEILKSTDGIQYTPFIKIAAAGNSDTSIDYRVEDQQLKALNFYKLIAIDIDGKQHHIGIRDISGWKCLDQQINAISAVYPNPIIEDEINVNIHMLQETENMQISITDIFGKRLFLSQSPLQKGINHLKFHLPQLSQGEYNVQIDISDGTQSIQKIMHIDAK